MQIHEGGCVCGALRYRAEGMPLRTTACHCTMCQKRTGSAFGVGAYFNAEQGRVVQGELSTYEHRSDESHRWIRFEFCPRCGTQVSWTLEALPGVRGIAIVALVDPKWPKLTRFSWFRSAHPWITPPEGLEVV